MKASKPTADLLSQEESDIIRKCFGGAHSRDAIRKLDGVSFVDRLGEWCLATQLYAQCGAILLHTFNKPPKKDERGARILNAARNDYIYQEMTEEVTTKFREFEKCARLAKYGMIIATLNHNQIRRGLDKLLDGYQRFSPIVNPNSGNSITLFVKSLVDTDMKLVEEKK